MGRFEDAEVFRDAERMSRENVRLRKTIVLGQMHVENKLELHERNRYGEERQ